MKDTLKPGIELSLTLRITENKTVPALYPESEEFVVMPEVFATGNMVGLIEWAYIKAINPHLNWPEEQTVGMHIDVNHVAATLSGFNVTVKTRLIEVDGRRRVFEVEADDGIEVISRDTHERFIIEKDRFDLKMKQKARHIRT